MFNYKKTMQLSSRVLEKRVQRSLENYFKKTNKNMGVGSCTMQNRNLYIFIFLCVCAGASINVSEVSIMFKI